MLSHLPSARAGELKGFSASLPLARLAGYWRSEAARVPFSVRLNGTKGRILTASSATDDGNGVGV
jgi:hypothetical protein